MDINPRYVAFCWLNGLSVTDTSVKHNVMFMGFISRESQLYRKEKNLDPNCSLDQDDFTKWINSKYEWWRMGKWGQAGTESIINVDGIKLRCVNSLPQPGDTYIAERNVGIQILTAAKIQDYYVVNTEGQYAYNVWECAKVLEIIE